MNYSGLPKAFRIRPKTVFLKISFLLVLLLFFSSQLKAKKTCSAKAAKAWSTKTVKSFSNPEFVWLYNIHVFLLDAYAYPLPPNLEFNAEKLVDLLVDMNFNTVTVATSGWSHLIPKPWKVLPLGLEGSALLRNNPKTVSLDYPATVIYNLSVSILE